MEGMRIGWIVAQGDILKKCREIRYYTTVCTPVLEQEISTLVHRHRDSVIRRNQEIVDVNFAILETWMSKRHSMFNWVKPQGGTVTFPKFKNAVNTDDFCKVLAEGYGILIPPGKYAFDTEGFIRIGYGRIRNFAEGLDVFESGLNEYFS